jgi:hypothetical protein
MQDLGLRQRHIHATVFLLLTTKCIKLSQVRNNIFKTLHTYMVRALLSGIRE